MGLPTCASCSTRYAVGLERCPNCGGTDRAGSGSVLPYLDIACPTEQCPRAGQVRRVHLRQVVPGVVEMPQLLLCASCGSAMPAVAAQIGPVPVPVTGLEETMPKITRHGGPSNAADQPPAIPPDAPAAAPAGEEEPSPGNSSSTSAEKPVNSPEPNAADPPRRARTTASRSKRARGESSTARSTDGSGEAERP